jgi:hypothetical protein
MADDKVIRFPGDRAPKASENVRLENAAMKRFALGRLPVGTMNRTEQRYGTYLTQLQQKGFILWFKFEAVKLRLADNTFYSPDFAVMNAAGVMEMHEVKGFWMDDARVKIKVAASLYPFKFIAVKEKAKKHGGGYETEEF